MKSETLFLTTDLSGSVFYLKDCNNAYLGSFTSEEAARNWCAANGYRLNYRGSTYSCKP